MCRRRTACLFWKFDNERLDNKNVFNFLEKEKPTLLFLDSAVNSAILSETGEEGFLLTTDIKFYIFYEF